jgi:hypothetical protein
MGGTAWSVHPPTRRGMAWVRVSRFNDVQVSIHPRKRARSAGRAAGEGMSFPRSFNQERLAIVMWKAESVTTVLLLVFLVCLCLQMGGPQVWRGREEDDTLASPFRSERGTDGLIICIARLAGTRPHERACWSRGGFCEL